MSAGQCLTGRQGFQSAKEIYHACCPSVDSLGQPNWLKGAHLHFWGPHASPTCHGVHVSARPWGRTAPGGSLQVSWMECECQATGHEPLPHRIYFLG